MVKRVGRLGRVTRNWAKSWRESVKSPGSRLILVDLAIDAADAADTARTAGDVRTYLAAATRLQNLVTAVDRDGSDDRAAGADDWAKDLETLLRSGPGVGDAEESGPA